MEVFERKGCVHTFGFDLPYNSPYIVQSSIGIRVVKILKIVFVTALVFLPVCVLAVTAGDP